MKEYINSKGFSIEKTVSLINAVCEQIALPVLDKHNIQTHLLRDRINLIAGKYHIPVTVSNHIDQYQEAINRIANDLVVQGILDETSLISRLPAHLSVFPPVPNP